MKITIEFIIVRMYSIVSDYNLLKNERRTYYGSQNLVNFKGVFRKVKVCKIKRYINFEVFCINNKIHQL